MGRLIAKILLFPFRFVFGLIFGFFAVLLEILIYPFRSFRHFWRAVFASIVFAIISFSLIFNLSYVYDTYGLNNAICFFTNSEENSPAKKVVRVIGDYSEGSGFFINDNSVITNYHVIEGEPSPKIILPNGELIIPTNLTHDPKLDLALLQVDSNHHDLVMSLDGPDKYLEKDLPVFAYGYPMGTDIRGEATMAKGHYIATRDARRNTDGSLIQTDIDLIEGMSGGPLTDYCGQVVGINTLGVAGLSMFIPAFTASYSIYGFTDTNITKLDLRPEESPIKAVEAFYSYLMLRRMAPAYALLSSSYRANATYEEWTSRFSDILSVQVVKTELVKGEKDKVFVKFVTRNWVSDSIDLHFYEGVWVTKLEDGVYRLTRSMIKEIDDPPSDWDITGPEF